MPIRQLLRRACGLVVLLASTASAQLAFSSAPILPPVPLAVIADVNGDGWLDVCGREYGCPAVYPGLADGTFAEPIGSSGYLASGFVLGDVNGDGRADLVAPHAFSRAGRAGARRTRSWARRPAESGASRERLGRTFSVGELATIPLSL